MNIDWQPLRDIISSHQKFVLSSHVRPDADALGSELAMAEFLRDQGKTVQIVNPSASPATLEFLDPDNETLKLGDGATSEDVLAADVHMVLDTSAWGQLADVGKIFRNSTATKVVIDHHASSDDLGAIEFKDVTCEATGSLIYNFAQSSGFEISQRAAERLFCAIATDTGWFRFPSTSGETMRIIGDLVDLGAAPHKLYRTLYERKSLARIRLSGVLLERAQSVFGGRLTYTVTRLDDFKKTGASPVDTEDIVNECLTVKGTQAAFIAVEQQNGQVKFSLRSRVPFNVSEVAEQFGGGGHHQASGAMVAGSVDEAVDRVLAAFESLLPQTSPDDPEPDAPPT